jgi:hypothetical protein
VPRAPQATERTLVRSLDNRSAPDSGSSPAYAARPWLSALRFGPSKGGLSPYVVIFLILFGSSIIGALYAFLA